MPSILRSPRHTLLTALLVCLLGSLLAACAQGTPEATGERLTAPDAGGEFEIAAPYRGRDRSRDRAVNIVEIVADDMRFDDLRHAPHLRRLVARRGITMRNAFASYPLCCPARASFFSGLHTHNHGVLNVRPPFGYRAFDDRRTIATSLQQAGYRTGLVGKYLNGYGGDEALAPGLRRSSDRGDSGRSGSDQGDEGEVDEGEVDAPAAPVISQFYVPDGWDEWRGAISGARCDPVCGGTYTYFNYAYSDNGVPTSAGVGAYSTDVIGRQSREVARRFHNQRLRTGDPFFLSVNYVAPHHGPGRGDVATRFVYRKTSGATADLRAPAVPQWALDLPRVRSIERGAGLMPGGRTETDLSDKPGRLGNTEPFTPSKRRALRQIARHRAAAVHLMDRQIGRLIGQLKKDREWRRTVFVFWSDNGYYQGEHARAEGKIDPYEPVLRIPMLITGPGMRSGTARYDPMTVVDLTATLIDLAGASDPHRPDGRSLSTVISDGDRGWDRAVLTEAAAWPIASGRSPRFRGDPRTSIGVRTSRYLYLHHRSGDREIYDLRSDPDQWENLAADRRWLREHAGVVRLLERVWRREADCRGRDRDPALASAGCSTLLPTALRADVETNRRATRAWYRHIARTYG